MKKILILIIAFVFMIGAITSCTNSCESSGKGHSYGTEECFRCHGSGLINDGFINFKTCPVCHGSGIVDSH